MDVIELAYKKHKDWINIVRSFGCSNNIAEDIVQEMYIQLIGDVEKGIDFMYNDEINHYYCYKVLRGIFINTHKKSAKLKKVYLDDFGDLEENDEGVNEEQHERTIHKIYQILSELYWYDRKVFYICSSGKSIAELSRETGITYYSLYNTYNNVKKHIKENL